MHRLVKIMIGIVATLLVVGSIAIAAANTFSAQKSHRHVAVDVVPVPYAVGDTALTRGKYLFESRGCKECHGDDGGGKVFIDSPNGLYVKTPNLTSGEGSATAHYGEVDWVRTIRHGVKPNGEPLLIMPAEDYNRFTDEDLAAVVAYIRGLPPVAGSGADIRFPLIMQALYAAGQIRDAAEKIDHHLPVEQPTPMGPTAAYGKYVANLCQGCHGPGFSGGKIPGTPPDWPPAANLTKGTGSVWARYTSADQLKAMFRSGVRPDGSAVSTVMPFNSLKTLSDNDVEAVYAYLQTVTPKDAGNR